jgi:hypothetical protein
VETTPKYIWAPQNLAVFTLFGQAGGVVLFGVPGALFSLQGAFIDGYFAQWSALIGAAFGGGIGVMIGLILLRVDRADVAAHAHRRELGAWWMIAVGAVSSAVVATVSVWVNFTVGDFFDGSPCFSDRIETLVPLQYTCLGADGPVALVLPQTIWLTLIALAGAAGMVLGLVSLRKATTGKEPAPIDTIVVVLGWATAAFLAIDAVLGALAVAKPGG